MAGCWGGCRERERREGRVACGMLAVQSAGSRREEGQVAEARREKMRRNERTCIVKGEGGVNLIKACCEFRFVDFYS